VGWGLPKITVEKISLIEAVDATQNKTQSLKERRKRYAI